MEINKEKVTLAFQNKILGVRNYSHAKDEFFVPDFLNIDELDYFLGEVATGESDITPARKVFLENYYGTEQIAKQLYEKGTMFKGEESFKSEADMVKWLKEVTPMQIMTFIESARGNIQDGATLREDLLPPSNFN